MKWLILLFSTSVYSANYIDSNCNQFVYAGAPISATTGMYLCKSDFAIHYNLSTKTAEYVVEKLQYPIVAVPRTNDFNVDMNIPVDSRADLGDYINTKLDRGHLSAAANHSTQLGMEQSFLLSNIVPQNPNNNRGIWKHLETNVRRYVQTRGTLYVITGTYYTSKIIIGDNLAVPNYLFKVIVDANRKTGIAFLIPNKAIPVTAIKQYALSIQQLEQKVHINFMPNLTHNDAVAIERVVSNLDFFGE